MSLDLFRCGAFLIPFLMAFPIFATESECITASILGADEAKADAILHHLKTELKIPIYQGKGPAFCWRLVIELQDRTSKILLAGQQDYDTVIHLDDFLPAIWPRVIALSVSGLWILAQGQPHEGPEQRTGTTGKEISASGRDSGDGPSTKGNRHPEDTMANPEQLEINADRSPQLKNPDWMLRFHLLTGARFIPKFHAGLSELASGISLSVSAVHLELSLIGLWGRKSLEAGRIFTTGGGLRATLFWQGVKRQRISLGIGPAVEAMGVFGYGRGDDDVRAHRGGYPVINCLLLAGGWLELTPQAMLGVAMGGGFSALYFDMSVDGRPVSGISGGSVNVVFGISVGR